MKTMHKTMAQFFAFQCACLCGITKWKPQKPVLIMLIKSMASVGSINMNQKEYIFPLNVFYPFWFLECI